jgi:hypothetical protein
VLSQGHRSDFSLFVSGAVKRRKAIPDIAEAAESVFLRKPKGKGRECGAAMMDVLINSHPLDTERIKHPLQNYRAICWADFDSSAFPVQVLGGDHCGA